MKSEFALIELLKKRIPRKLQGPYGIGDDAAILPGKGQERWLLTTDALVEGIDFTRAKMTPPELVGRKALAVNLSDIAAMGGVPYACVISLGIPPKLNERWLQQFYAGLVDLAKRYHTLCVGGDISRAREFFVSIALLGKVRLRQLVTRHGAKPGDWIMVTGRLGGSILGRHLKFEPRIREAQFLVRRFHPTAMIDISDGFLQDLKHILKESRAGARLEITQIPISADAKRLAKGNPQKALEHALTDGEDFELIFTVPNSKKDELRRSWRASFPAVPLSCVGKVREGQGEISWTREAKPIRNLHLSREGYSHF